MFIIVDYIITKVTTDDEPFLWEMLYQSLYVPDSNEPFSRDILKEPSIAKYLEGWGRSGDLGFVARLNDGTPIGSVTARLFSEKNKGYGIRNGDFTRISGKGYWNYFNKENPERIK